MKSIYINKDRGFQKNRLRAWPQAVSSPNGDLNVACYFATARKNWTGTVPVTGFV